MSVCAMGVSEGGHGAVGGLSGYQIEEELGGSGVTDPTRTCGESGDLHAENWHFRVIREYSAEA